MSRILKETEEEITALYKLGLVSKNDYNKMKKLTKKRNKTKKN